MKELATLYTEVQERKAAVEQRNAAALAADAEAALTSFRSLVNEHCSAEVQAALGVQFGVFQHTATPLCWVVVSDTCTLQIWHGAGQRPWRANFTHGSTLYLNNDVPLADQIVELVWQRREHEREQAAAAEAQALAEQQRMALLAQEHAAYTVAQARRSTEICTLVAQVRAEDAVLAAEITRVRAAALAGLTAWPDGLTLDLYHFRAVVGGVVDNDGETQWHTIDGYAQTERVRDGYVTLMPDWSEKTHRDVLVTGLVHGYTLTRTAHISSATLPPVLREYPKVVVNDVVVQSQFPLQDGTYITITHEEDRGMYVRAPGAERMFPLGEAVPVLWVRKCLVAKARQ